MIFQSDRLALLQILTTAYHKTNDMSLDPGSTNVLIREKAVDDHEDSYCLHRKFSRSKSLSIGMVKREIWDNVSEKITLGYLRPYVDKKFHPEYCGIVEGILQIDPWLLPRNPFIMVEIICQYNYDSSELDKHDITNESHIYKRKIELLPAFCEKLNYLCLKEDPEDLKTYSTPLLCLYRKFGGRIGSSKEKSEYIDRNGANSPFYNGRFKETCIRRTDARLITDTPNDPHIIINMPFKFDISGQPDSIILHHDPKKDSFGERDPPNRSQLMDDAMHGFQMPEIPSDGITSESEPEERHCHMHPNERFRYKGNRRKIQWTDQKDLGHKDSYMWRYRPKKRPQDGIKWFVKAYAAMAKNGHPLKEHEVRMSIRKFSYASHMQSVQNKYPNVKYIDFCIAKTPEIGIDAGVITMVARLNQTMYTLGDPVNVFIKIHNRSVRLIQKVVIELIQKTKMNVITGRTWRCTVCKRILSNEQLQGELPIFPGTENCYIETKLYPWATIDQAKDMNCKLSAMEKPMRNHELDAWSLKKSPKVDKNSLFSEMPRQRHTDIPFQNIMRQYPSMSTIDDEALRIIHNIDIDESRPLVDPCEWRGEPYKKSATKRNTSYPYEEEVQKWISQIDIQNKSVDVQKEPVKNFEKYQLIEKKCRSKETITVQYQVQISLELLDHGRKDGLLFENMLSRNMGDKFESLLKTSKLRAFIGPRIVLPLVYVHEKPLKKIVPPVGNFRVEQRQFWKPTHIPKNKAWEPPLGRGGYVKRKDPAICEAKYKMVD